MLNKTPLYDTHLRLGAKMVPFAGYEMPVSYTGIVEEHQAVRQAAGMFDVSHMGEFELEGLDALAVVQKLTCNDAGSLFPGRVQYSALINPNGGIIDDLLVYQTEAEKFMLVVNASNIEKDFEWIESHLKGTGCKLTDRSQDIALLALQGPKAIDILQSLTHARLADIAYYHFTTTQVAGIENVLVSATGYTGSGGFELYVANENAAALWDAIMQAGAPLGLKPAGLGCRDTLRLEMGFCLYGNDIDDTTTPLEAGLGWITKLKKGDFIGKPALESQKAIGLTRKLVGLELTEKNIPRSGYDVLAPNGRRIGKVTSGTLSPSLGIPIALGYVEIEFAREGEQLLVQIRNKQVPATVSKLPFYKPS